MPEFAQKLHPLYQYVSNLLYTLQDNEAFVRDLKDLQISYHRNRNFSIHFSTISFIKSYSLFFQIKSLFEFMQLNLWVIDFL